MRNKSELKDKLAEAIYEQTNFQEEEPIIEKWKASIIAGRVISVLEQITVGELVDIIMDKLQNE